MTLTVGQLSIVVTIAIFVLSGIFALLANLLKSAVFGKLKETSDGVTTLGTNTSIALKTMETAIHAEMTAVSDKLTEFKEEVIKEYVRREELLPNDLAHKEFYEKIGKANERIAVLESENRSLKAASYQYRRNQQQPQDRRSSDDDNQHSGG